MYPFFKPGDRLVVQTVPVNTLQSGDILVLKSPGSDHQFFAHRLVDLLPDGRGITKGDAMLDADPNSIKLNGAADRVEAILRNRRLISLASGPRSRLKAYYALLSRSGLTTGVMIQRIKTILSDIFPNYAAARVSYDKPYLLSILRDEKTDGRAELDWDCLIRRFHCEGMAGIAYRRLNRSKKIPLEVREKLAVYYHAFVAQNLNNIEALKTLEQSLAGEEIEVMTLKGISLLNHLYRGVGTRPMADIDLMVRSEDRESLVALLKNLGYRQNYRSRNSFASGRTVLDLHCHIMNTDRISSREQLFPAGMAPIWGRSIPWDLNCRWLRRPDDLDSILILSQHLMKHYFSRLIWIEDIYRMIKGRNAIFWCLLSKRAEELEQIKPLSYALYLLKKYYQFSPPPSTEENKPISMPSSLETFFLDLSCGEQALELLAPMMAAYTIRGFGRRLQFALENLFPRKEVLEGEFGRNSPGRRLLFFPFRLCQTMVMLLRHCRIVLRTAFR